MGVVLFDYGGGILTRSINCDLPNKHLLRNRIAGMISASQASEWADSPDMQVLLNLSFDYDYEGNSITGRMKNLNSNFPHPI